MRPRGRGSRAVIGVGRTTGGRVRRRLLVLAAGGVLLTGCLGGRSEPPSVSCPSPIAYGCYSDDALIGPGTYRLPGSRYVFDLPAGWWVSVTEYDGKPAAPAGVFVITHGPTLDLVQIAAPGNAWLWLDPHTGEEVSRHILFGPGLAASIGHPPGVSRDRVRAAAALDFARIPVEILSLFDEIVESVRVGE